MGSGRLEAVSIDAANRLRRLGITPLSGAAPPSATTDPETLAMALMCRLHAGDIALLRNAVDPFPTPAASPASTGEADLEPTTTTR